MKIQCVWEHNGDDSILYSANFVGAFTRGKSKDEAVRKMPSEILSYLAWKGDAPPDALEPEIVQEKASALTVSDADSDVLFNDEKAPLTAAEYEALKVPRGFHGKGFQRFVFRRSQLRFLAVKKHIRVRVGDGKRRRFFLNDLRLQSIGR